MKRMKRIAYLEPTDPDAFKDMPKKEVYKYYPERTLECPKCKGHGGWHLELDAYGKDKHFDAHCTQCWGYGLVDPKSKSATCIHEWQEKNIGRCLHLWTCIHCGETTQIDSSD